MMMGLRNIGSLSASLRSLRYALISAFIALSASCGGGGGGGGGGFLPNDGTGNLTSFTLELSLVDTNGNPTTSVSSTFPATLRVRVREDNFDAAAVVGEVVAANAAFAVIAPTNGQALTDSEGVAEFEIQAGATLGADTINITVTSPAGQITASIGVEVVSAGFQLGFFDGTTFVPGELGLSTNSIAFRGTAVVRVAVVDEMGVTLPNIRQIRLSSACSLSGIASFRAIGDATEGSATLTVDTVDGLANAEYVSGSCEDMDEITAELVQDDATASVTISIAARDANFIGFVSADPSEGEEGADRTIIALKGTGGPGRPEVATLVFEVLEEAVVLEAGDPQPGQPGYLELASRAPLAGISVNFGLTNDLGGITLNTESGVTDAQGLVEVEVLSGNVATSTLVTATFDAADADGGSQQQTATSNQIVIGTGLPDQNSISISTEVFRVPNAANVDGVEVAITVRMADKFNNPVADGTSAVFTTEYGAIDSSCLTGISNGARFQTVRNATPPLRGTCTVLWVSQAPRFPVFNSDRIQTIEDDNSYFCPSHTGSFGPCPDDLGAIRGLRTTLTVTVVGEEFFVDGNGNGVFNNGELFENLPEAFTDHNEDNVYTPFAGPNCPFPSSDEDCEAAGLQEEFIDFNGDNVFSTNVDPNTGEGVYNGSLCPVEGDGIFCSRELVNVRADIVLTLSSVDGNQQALIANTRNEPDVATDRIVEGDLHVIYIADIFNNAPGAGTTISLTTSGDCTLLTADTFTAPDTSAPGAFGFGASVEGDGAGGQLIVSSQAPDAAAPTVVRSFPCVTFAPPDPNLVTGGT
ncbi:MAG: hypothetical protein AAF098_00650 [Pseudomonadota bacterium]